MKGVKISLWAPLGIAAHAVFENHLALANPLSEFLSKTQPRLFLNILDLNKLTI